MKPSLPSLAGALRQHLGGLVGGALSRGRGGMEPQPHITKLSPEGWVGSRETAAS